MSKVKSKTADIEMFKNSQNTIAIKNEPGEMEKVNGLQCQEIKEEPELSIKSEFEWLPTKLEDEQHEYYLEYQSNKILAGKEYESSTTQSERNEIEEFSIRYISDNEEENESEDGYDDDDDDGNYISGNDEDYNEDNTSDGDSDSENYSEEDSCGPSKSKKPKKSATTGTFSQRLFRNWICSKYIKYLCTICNKEFNSLSPLNAHMIQRHKDLTDKVKSSNYFTNQKSQFICKKCNKYYHNSHTLVLHSLRHLMNTESLNIFKCNICEGQLSTLEATRKHIIKDHPDTKDEFESHKEVLKKERYECPLCPVIYNEFNHIRFHFIDKHPSEYGELFSYPCHLCENTAGKNFNNEQEFFEHLFNEHNFEDWTLINFDFYPKDSDDPHFMCTKCLEIFTEMNLMEFLRHYLGHINYYRLCKCCNAKIKRFDFFHMCKKWFKELQTRAAIKTKKKKETSLTILQEFEYIKHTCPFCNKEFETMRNWQIHLRELHRLDTLKGLEMEKIPNDSNRLKCNICKTFIVNSSVQLHSHRFQHLPYKPYKCKNCSRTFDSYKTALNHVVKKCQDEHNQTHAMTFEQTHKIVCPLCDNLKFININSLSKHILDTHNNFLGYFTKQSDNSMKCNLCQIQLVANDENKCRNHMSLVHFARKSFMCLKCSHSFTSRTGCYQHVICHLVKPVNTQENSKNKGLSGFLRQELEKCPTLKNCVEFISYACPECNESLENDQLWQDHINEKHNFFREDNLAIKDTLDGIWKCLLCQLNVENWSTFQKQAHKLLHMTYKAFICKLCCFRGPALGAVNRHLRSTHFAKGSHKCPICPVILTTPYEKTEHLKNTHPSSEWPDTNKQQLNDSNIKNELIASKTVRIACKFDEFSKFVCPECNDPLVSYQLWEKHINEKHDFFRKHNLAVKDPTDGLLKCPICGIRAHPRVIERKNHKLTHMPYKGFLCKLCDYRGKTRELLNTHHRATHFIKGEFDCPICELIFTAPYERFEHMRNSHPRSEWPKRMCPICCTMLSTVYSLKDHLKTHEMSCRSGSVKRTLSSNPRTNPESHLKSTKGSHKYPIAKGSHRYPIAKGSHKYPILTTPYEKTEHIKNTHPSSELPDSNKQQQNDSNIKMKDHRRTHATSLQDEKVSNAESAKRNFRSNLRKKFKMSSE